jgi:hypothetical protein
MNLNTKICPLVGKANKKPEIRKRKTHICLQQRRVCAYKPFQIFDSEIQLTGHLRNLKSGRDSIQTLHPY